MNWSAWRLVLSDSESPEVQDQWLNRRFTAPVQTVFSAFPAYDALIKLKIKETEAWLAVLPRFDKKKMFKCDFDEESNTKEGKE